MAYRRKPVQANSLTELGEYTQQELAEVEKAFAMTDFIRLVEKHAAPNKLFDGLTVFADGTDWNPGSGQGVYTYYAGAWHKLG